ncbi:hypothetical protein ADK65_23970 [Streptomyces sp. NRRL B-1140]|uniref:hypothetical protein n=1 Tax=Streptomyces sp. NRRL B-1140 TaxID=1415549 RepID=UPI0006AF39F0|nr:hypothetical protein [Streptomyces sp. NRRL B-1140]KOV97984.1 hypothetical protein ADK65_23970 [Streptomyces sp. NRRL B-1140]
MGAQGERRRRVWRGLVIGWALLVAVAGCLTLWMQDSAEPRGPYVWQEADPGEAPDLPPCPQTGEGERVACAYLGTP